MLLANDVVSVCMGLNGSRLQLDGLNHEQFFGLVTNYGLNFEAITDQDSRVLSPITDHGKTIYHPVYGLLCSYVSQGFKRSHLIT